VLSDLKQAQTFFRTDSVSHLVGHSAGGQLGRGPSGRGLYCYRAGGVWHKFIHSSLWFRGTQKWPNMSQPAANWPLWPSADASHPLHLRGAKWCNKLDGRRRCEYSSSAWRPPTWKPC